MINTFTVAIVTTVGGFIKEAPFYQLALLAVAFWCLGLVVIIKYPRKIAVIPNPNPGPSPILQSMDTGVIEIKRPVARPPDQSYPVSPPHVGKSTAEREKEKGETLDKDDKLATALKRLGDQRMDIIHFGKERYETFWGDGDDLRRRDPEYNSALEFAASVVRECFGNAEAAYFLSDAGFPRVPQDSPFPKYSQVIMNLEQYELRIINLRNRLQ